MNADRVRGWRNWGEARGFTLVEMVTVMAIIVVLSVMSIVATGPFLARNRLRYAARQAHAAILQARHYAIATNSTASVVIYYGERLAVVTNSLYEPIDAPTMLPEGLKFLPSTNHLPTMAGTCKPNAAQWAQILGDYRAAEAAGYKKDGGTGVAFRPVLVVTFQNDGTVRYVTPSATSARTSGTIVVSISGYSVGSLKGDCGADDDEIEIASYAAFKSSGIVVMDNEIVSYDSRNYSPQDNRVTLKGVKRGLFTDRQKHSSGGAVYAGWDSAILVIFPLTGGVVQAI